MKNRVNPYQVGLILGILTASWYLIWSVIVLAGFAKPVLDWVLALQFLSDPFEVQQFNLTTACILLVVNFVIGFLVGWAGAWLWNWKTKKK